MRVKVSQEQIEMMARACGVDTAATRNEKAMPMCSAEGDKVSVGRAAKSRRRRLARDPAGHAAADTPGHKTI
jgi:hypothetical protein